MSCHPDSHLPGPSQAEILLHEIYVLWHKEDDSPGAILEAPFVRQATLDVFRVEELASSFRKDGHQSSRQMPALKLGRCQLEMSVQILAAIS